MVHEQRRLRSHVYERRKASDKHLADLESQGDDGGVVAAEDDWDDAIESLTESNSGRPDRASGDRAYATRRMSQTTMGKNGFKIDKRAVDTRNPPPGSGDDPAKPNGKNRNGATMRSFSCKYYQILSFPSAFSTQSAFFSQPLEVAATFLL